MSHQTSHDYIDRDLSAPGHTASIVYVHQTRGMGLHCSEDGWYGGGFRPDRWRDKHMAEAFKRHLDHAATGATITHGLAANVDAKICQCVRCSIPWRMARLDKRPMSAGTSEADRG
jgi:hypothetical protein